MNYHKTISLLMIYLIISLTFLTSLALGEIYSVNTQGRDQAPGTIRPADTVTVTTSSLMGTNIDPTNSDNYTSMTCGNATPVICTYSKTIYNATDKISFGVKEIGSGAVAVAEAYVDNLPPKINSLVMSSTGRNVKATYRIVDEANIYSPGKCSGFKKVDLILNGRIAATQTHPPGTCTINSEILGTIENTIGTVNASFEIQDYVGNKANKTGGQVGIESQAPKIGKAILYRAGTSYQITKVSFNATKIIDADLEVLITEETGIGEVTAMMAEFSPENDSTPVTAGSCELDENSTYHCLFRNIGFKPAKANPKIIITANDVSGNTANQTIPFSFTTVNSAGTVTRLGPDASRCYQDKCYVPKGSTIIIAQISGSSSFFDNNIMINGAKAVCTGEGGWSCNATTTVSGNVILKGEDDLGNPIEGKATNIIVDAIPPEITKLVNVTDCPVSPESLIVKLNVTEKESPTMKIKANTAAVSEQNTTENACTRGTGDNWECILTVSSTKNERINTQLEVIVEDFAGNEAKLEVPVSICIGSTETPNLITEIRTRGTLPKIDKKVASKIEVKIPIGLSIETGAEIMERSRPSCSGTPGAKQAYLIDETSLKPTLIIPLSYNSEWDKDDKVHVNCTMEFKVRDNNIVYTTLEREEINTELVAYNQGLGTLNKTYEDKITAITKELKELDKDIAKIEKTYKWLGTLCSLAKTIGRVNQIVQTAKSVLWNIALVMFFKGKALFSAGVAANAILPGSGLIAMAAGGALMTKAQAFWSTVNNFAITQQEIVEKFVWPAGWWPTGANTIGLAVKLGCSYYTCKFYETGTIISIGTSIAAGAFAPDDKDGDGIPDRNQIGKSPEENNFITAQSEAAGAFGAFAKAKTDLAAKRITSAEYQKIEKNYNDAMTNLQSAETAWNDYQNANQETSETPEQQETQPMSEEEKANLEAAGKLSIAKSDLKAAEETLNEYKKNNPQYFDKNGEPNQAYYDLPDEQQNLYDGLFTEYQAAQSNYDIANENYKPVSLNNVIPPTTTTAIKVNNFVDNAKEKAKGIFAKIRGGPIDAHDYGTMSRELMLQNSISAVVADEGQYIQNPFKSKYYDGMCEPAKLFNARKEREILCKRLACFEKMKSTGGPLEACEYDYDLDMCLYVVSARYKLEGHVSYWSSLIKALGNNLLGIGITFAYMFWPMGCSVYQIPMGPTVHRAATVVGGWQTVACGVYGSLTGLQEIASVGVGFATGKSPLSDNMIVDIPADGQRFCDGVSY